MKFLQANRGWMLYISIEQERFEWQERRQWHLGKLLEKPIYTTILFYLNRLGHQKRFKRTSNDLKTRQL